MLDISNSYRIKVLRALMDCIDFSKDRKNILSTVIVRHIEFYKGTVSHIIIHEMDDYTEYACQMEPILYPLLSNKITRYEKALMLNFAVIFGYREVVKILLKLGVQQDSFLMSKPYKLIYNDLYPINFAYYNGDVGIAKMLIDYCTKITYITHVYESGSKIEVIEYIFGRETIYDNYEQKNEAIKRIVKTLNIPFPYLYANIESMKRVYYMLQDNNAIKSCIRGGYIPKNVSFTLDASKMITR